MPQEVAIVGGTGQEGFGLALRWARADRMVFIGSRDPQRARAAAESARELVPGSAVEGLANEEAVARAPIVVLTVPLTAQVPTLKSIRDHLQPDAIVVDTTVPLEKAVGGRLSRIVQLWDGSAAEQAERYVGKLARVTAAFHSLGSEALRNLDRDIDSDVLVTGNDREARAEVASLVEDIPGARAVDFGLLENSRYAEQTAALLITLNLQHKSSSAGLRFTGIDRRPPPVSPASKEP